MEQIRISTACQFVSKALDELTNTGDMDNLAADINDIEKLVEASIEEAAVRIHLSAPSYLLEGEAAKMKTDYSLEVQDKVLTITMLKECIRISRVKANDSNMVVTDLVLEDSPEGRMQLDKYARGVPDDPVVVLQKKWNGNNKPILKYYTTNMLVTEGSAGIVELEYVPYPYLEDDAVNVCPRLKYAVLNELTAMVMESLSLVDKASVYRAKAQEYLK